MHCNHEKCLRKHFAKCQMGRLHAVYSMRHCSCWLGIAPALLQQSSMFLPKTFEKVNVQIFAASRERLIFITTPPHVVSVIPASILGGGFRLCGRRLCCEIGRRRGWGGWAASRSLSGPAFAAGRFARLLFAERRQMTYLLSLT